MGNMDDPGADWNELARENAALRKRVEDLERSIAHVMRRRPGDVCPVCSPVVPLPQKYGDEIPKSLDMVDLCQAAVVRADKLQADLDAALEWIRCDEEEPSFPPGLCQRVKALLEKRKEANRG